MESRTALKLCFPLAASGKPGLRDPVDLLDLCDCAPEATDDPLGERVERIERCEAGDWARCDLDPAGDGARCDLAGDLLLMLSCNSARSILSTELKFSGGGTTGVKTG